MRLSRRNFLKTTAATTAGIWVFGGELALGQIPWEDDSERDSKMLDSEGSPAVANRQVVGKGFRTDAPVLAVNGNTVFLLWVSGNYERETLWFANYSEGGFSDPVRVVEDELILHPAIAFSEESGIVATWAQHDGEGWKTNIGTLDRTGKIISLSSDQQSGELNWHPAISVHGNSAIVVWENRSDQHFRIMGRWISQSNGAKISINDPFVIAESEGDDCRRPAVVLEGEKTAMIAWDQTSGRGGSAIYVRRVSENESMKKPIQVTDHPAFNHAPDLALNSEGDLYVAWHSNRKHTTGQELHESYPEQDRFDDEWDIPRWIDSAILRGDEIHQVNDPQRFINTGKEGTDQSFEFARIVTLPRDGFVVTGRASHNFMMQFQGENGASELFRIPVDGWGGRGQFLNAASDGDGALWVVRRDIGNNILHRITGIDSYDGKPELRAVGKINPDGERKVSNLQILKKRWDGLEDIEGVDAPLLPFYGDLHGHTWMSDGVGDVDEYFRIRKEYYDDDFASLTDHDTFVRNSILPGQFEYQKEITDHYNGDDFVTLFGQEYTTARIPNGVGHKCIYDVRKDIPLMDHKDSRYNSTKKVNAALRERDAIWIPHHTGWLGTDWEDAEDDVQPLVEIVSVHGCFEHMGNRPIQHRGGMRGSFVQDALAAGHKIGIIGGSDAHGLIWHHRMSRKRDCFRTGLAVVLAEDLSRESIFDAMKKRRVYATTGTKPMLDFRVNNHIMGSDISVTDPVVEISANVTSREDIVYLSLIKDNKVIYEYGGGDFVARFTIKDELTEPGTHWYYLRVEFDHQEMAWSSPVWVTI